MNSSSSSRHFSPSPTKLFSSFAHSTTGSLSATSGASTQTFRKLAIVGKIKEQKANITLYGRIAITDPSPQTSTILFPEGNVKLLNYFIHPLDSQQRPYAFYPDTPPPIHAARTYLGVKAPRDEYYVTALARALGHHHLVEQYSPRNGKEGLKEATELCGQIGVQNYAFTYTSPKVLMPPDDEPERHPVRRSSFGVASPASSSTAGERFKKNEAYFIIAMELEVPILEGSSESPYMLYLQTPSTCTQNKIRLIMPPVTPPPASPVPLSASTPSSSTRPPLQSATPLSSDRQPSWNTFCSPALTPPQARNKSRSNSTASSEGFFADDEEEAEPAVIRIEGTFLATSSLTIRWARRTEESETSGTQSPIGRSKSAGRVPRKLMAVGRVESHAKYTIGGVEAIERPAKEGNVWLNVVPVDLEVQATCIGLFHPGVETELAVDALLDSALHTVMWRGGQTEEGGGDEERWKRVASTAGVKDYVWSSKLERQSSISSDALSLDDDRSDTHSRASSVSPTPQGPIRQDSLDRTPSHSESIFFEEPPPTISSQSRLPPITPRARFASSRPQLPHAQSSTLMEDVKAQFSQSNQLNLLRAPLPGHEPELSYSFEDRLPEARERPRDPMQTHKRRPTVSSDGRGSFLEGTPLPTSSNSLQRTNTHSTGSFDSNIGSLTDPSDNSPQKQRSRAGSSASSNVSAGQLRPLPDHPMTWNINLLPIIAAQKFPNPSTMDFSFTIKGSFYLVLYPEDSYVELPLLRFFNAQEHVSRVEVAPMRPSQSSWVEKTHFSFHVLNPGRADEGISDVETDGVIGKAGISRVLTIGAPRVLQDGHVIWQNDEARLTFPPVSRSPTGELHYSDRTPSAHSSTSGRTLENLRTPSRLPALQLGSVSSSRRSGMVSNLVDSHDLVMPAGDHFVSAHSSVSPQQTPHPPLTFNPPARSPLPTASAILSAASSEANLSTTSEPAVPTIAEVKITVIPSPPKLNTPTSSEASHENAEKHEKQAKSRGRSHLIQMTITWPSSPNSPRRVPTLEFGLELPTRGSLADDAPQLTWSMEILSAHINGRPLTRTLYSQNQSQLETRIPALNINEVEGRQWGNWAQISLPPDYQSQEARADITYAVHEVIVETMSQRSKRFHHFGLGYADKPTQEILLPCFELHVESLEVTVEEPDNYPPFVLISNLEPKPSSPYTLRSFARPPLAPVSLNLTPSRRSSSISGRLRKVTQSLWILWAIGITIGMGFLLWQSNQDHGSTSGRWLTRLNTAPARPILEAPGPISTAFDNYYTHLADAFPFPTPATSRPPPHPMPKDVNPPLDLWGDEDALDVDDPDEMKHPEDVHLPVPTGSEVEHSPRFDHVNPFTQIITHFRACGTKYVRHSREMGVSAFTRLLKLIGHAFHYPNN